MCIIIVQMYKKALTHEHPSDESVDEVKGEGVVFSILRNNVIRNNAM